MVGIWNKIKNGLNTIQNKVQQNLIPFVGKLGDFVNSKPVQTAASFITPALTAVNPALGTAVSTGMNFLGGLGNAANEFTKNNSVLEMAQNYKKGKLTSPQDFAKRPNQLHERIQLKALPPADENEDEEPIGEDEQEYDQTPVMNQNGSYVEEVD
jgi:hypothetical protein